MKKKFLMIDCDPGCDDALAITYAIRKNFLINKYEKIFLVATGGNVNISRTTINIKKIVALNDKFLNDILIFGHEGKIEIEEQKDGAEHVHGKDGLGDVVFNSSKFKENFNRISINGRPEKFYNLMLNSQGSTFDLVYTGPLTNLSNFFKNTNLKQKENFFAITNKIVVMGGAFDCDGNITPHAEFNFYYDPESVNNVLENVKKFNFKDIYFVPLDITEKFQLSKNEIYRNNLLSEVGKNLLLILEKYFYFHYSTPQVRMLKKNCMEQTCKHKNLGECEFYNIEDKIKICSKEKILYSHLHDPLAIFLNFLIDEYKNMKPFLNCCDFYVSTKGDVKGKINKVSSAEKFFYFTPQKVNLENAKKWKKDIIEHIFL